MYVISVGKPYPGPVSQTDGARLELGPDGDLNLFIQTRNQSAVEYASLKAGFDSYSYYEAPGEITLAAWVFKFPEPIGYLEAPFHAGLYKDGRAAKCLAQRWNTLHVTSLDGNIVRIIRLSGLNFEAVNIFHNTIRKQLSEHVTRAGYDNAVQNLFRLTTEEIFIKGRIFRHGLDNRKVIESQPLRSTVVLDWLHVGEKTELIERAFRDMPHMLFRDKTYHSQLPKEIADWYCYPIDSGHSILCLLACHIGEAFSPGTDPTDHLIPVPVKAVLRGYTVKDGFVVVDLPYSEEIGLEPEDSDDEF